jgi:hypothetical protein
MAACSAKVFVVFTDVFFDIGENDFNAISTTSSAANQKALLNIDFHSFLFLPEIIGNGDFFST